MRLIGLAVILTLGLMLAPLAAQAQRAEMIYRIGFLSSSLSPIPVLKQFVGTDEFSIAMFAGALFDGHCRDHAGQIAKIRNAVRLPEAK